jgi:hypothetical protein
VRQCSRKYGVGRRANQPAQHRTVQDHTEEVLIVVEADTVSDPWAVMVHLQHT